MCNTKVPRAGSSMKYYSTTNLVHHLSTEHNGIEPQYLKQKTSKEEDGYLNKY